MAELFFDIIGQNFSDDEQLTLRVVADRREGEINSRREGTAVGLDDEQLEAFRLAHTPPSCHSQELFTVMEHNGFPARYLSMLSKTALTQLDYEQQKGGLNG